MTGKLGLTVTYKGRSGLIRRMKVSPKNPKSAAQTSQRSILRQCAQAFDGLTQLQQDAWNTAANRYKSRASVGQSGPLTGLQFFVQINAANLTIGNTVVATPPVKPAPTLLPITALSITNTGGVIAIRLAASDAPPEGTMLWGCAPQNSGVRRLVSPRYLGTLDSPVGGFIVITTAYTAKFGVPAVGQRVFVEANTNVNGFEGIRSSWSALVPAAA